MLDRVRIRTLRDAGHTLEEIAATVGVAKRSVQRILKEPVIPDPESAPTPGSRGVGRPSTIEAYQDQVERILKEELALPTVEILSRLRGLGYTGGKSAVYELVKAIRPPKSKSPEVRFEGVPGEFSQHDFGSVTVAYADGSSERVHFFASRLKHSRWTHVVTVPNEKVEPLIRALLRAFESFGGVPLRASLLGSYLGPEFVTEGRSLILGGRSGRGKTHLAVSIAYRAIQNGYDARFTTAAELIDELSAAAREGRLSDKLVSYVQPHVLVIDEVGYLTYSADAANVLFQVVDHRYLHKKPMLFTTNKPLTQWGRVLHDPDLAEAITDRVLERGRFIQLRGPSYRTRHLKNTEREIDALKGDEEEGDQPCS